MGEDGWDTVEVEQSMNKLERGKDFGNIKVVLENKGKQQVNFKKQNPLMTNRFFLLDYVNFFLPSIGKFSHRSIFG